MYNLRNQLVAFGLLVALFGLAPVAGYGQDPAPPTAITYQGRLSEAGMPANGAYDLEFRLFTSEDVTTGSILTTVALPAVQVANGLFTVQLDFGGAAYFDGTARALEIGVRPAGSTDPYTTLAPRQPLTATPYALRSIRANVAEQALTAQNAAQLGSISFDQYVLTTDARLSDERTPLAGNSSYIQNTTSPQTGANFNVAGNGTVGGTLSANTVSASTVTAVTFNATNVSNGYQIGGNTVLRTPGAFNLFAGQSAGASNSSGYANNFFGRAAGSANTTGSGNTFVGDAAGGTNTNGGFNTYLGFNAKGAAGIMNATAIGANAQVTTSNTMVFGTSAVTVQVPGSLNVTGTLGINGAFSANAVNATTQYNLGGTRVVSAQGTNNIFVGKGINATGSSNAFFGANAGNDNTTGSSNTFIGSSAGRSNTSGGFNVFVGTTAGNLSTTGNSNTFIGTFAGDEATTGARNTFLGHNAGEGVTSGSDNTLIGHAAQGSNSGSRNVAIGSDAGGSSGSNNTFIGHNAGGSGSGNTYIGYNASGEAGLTNAAAIGANAYVDRNNTIVLGKDANVEITKGSLSIFNGGFYASSNGTVNGNLFAGRLIVNNGGQLNGKYKVGEMHVTTLSKEYGSFRIDHPLDPANKYLFHSFVESPDMMNIYNGNVTTDARGFAAIALPAYFGALNKDFRYQLTVMGRFAQAVVHREIKDNRFVVKTSKPRVRVSWQVTGIRDDAIARAQRIQVEVNKPAEERGTYLFPEGFLPKDDRPERAQRHEQQKKAAGARPSNSADARLSATALQ